MTDKSDWVFRAQYFRDQAKVLRRKAAELEAEAEACDESAANAASLAGYRAVPNGQCDGE